MKKHILRSLSVLLSIITAAVSLTPALSASADAVEKLCILGDVTGDGVVSLKDASMIQRASVGLEVIPQAFIPVGDVSADDECTLVDAYIIQQYVTGIEIDYPVNKDGVSIGDEFYLYIDEPEDDTETDVPDDDTDTDSVVYVTDIDDTSIDVPDTDVEQTDSDLYYSDIDDTEIDIVDTEIIDSEILDTDIIDSDVYDTDTDEIEIDVPEVEVLPLEEINAQLNGTFERGEMIPEGWEKVWSYMKTSSAPGEGVGGSTAMKIDHPSMAMSFGVHHVVGLEPGRDYKFRVMVKANSVERKTENGVCVDVGTCLNGMYYTGRDDAGNLDRGKGYMMYATETSMAGSFDWKEITVYFVADAYGRADIVLYLDAKGTVWFDNVVIETADFDSEVTRVRRFEGEHTGIIVYQEDIADYTEQDMWDWVADIDEAYEMMADLMGALPFNGDKIYFASSEEMMVLQFQALGAINPLKWNRGYMKNDIKEWCTTRVQSAVPYHEMGHNFDTMYPWSHASENTADFKAAYVIMQKGEGQVKATSTYTAVDMATYRDFLKSVSGSSYDNTFAQRKSYTNLNYFDAVPYIMIRMCDAVGWDTVKQVYRDFAKNYDTYYSKSVSKYMYWVMCLQNKYNETHPDATGYEIYDTYPDGELDYYKDLMIACSGTNGYALEQDIHCVKFVDPDGNRLWFEFVPHGHSVSYKEIPDHEKYGAFTGWDQDVSSVVSDMTVTANYENYVSAGTITAAADSVYEGEYLNVAVNSAIGSNYSCDIIAMKDGAVVFESGYTNNYSAKVFLADSGDYTLFAKLKDNSGNEFTTSKLYFKAGKAVTIYYSGFNNPNIHYKAENAAWTAVPGKPMTSNGDVSGYSYKFVIPISTDGGKAEICFNDGNNNWDNNGEKNYVVTEGAYGIRNGSVTKITG